MLFFASSQASSAGLLNSATSHFSARGEAVVGTMHVFLAISTSRTRGMGARGYRSESRGGGSDRGRRVRIGSTVSPASVRQRMKAASSQIRFPKRREDRVEAPEREVIEC